MSPDSIYITLRGSRYLLRAPSSHPGLKFWLFHPVLLLGRLCVLWVLHSWLLFLLLLVLFMFLAERLSAEAPCSYIRAAKEQLGGARGRGMIHGGLSVSEGACIGPLV